MDQLITYQEIKTHIKEIEDNVQKVILGKKKAVRLALVTLLAKGHLLIEDVPGVGKTTLARALSKCFDGTFRRIQFTSDLLPTDILGVSVYNRQNESFEFHEGPIFANFILADEINRTTPKTQSCLLEAMNTSRVSIDKTTHRLPHPFLVLATQNPIEFQGTYPLPSSQLDRFLMRISMGYPSLQAEKEILRIGLNPTSVEDLETVATGEELERIQDEVPKVAVEDSLLDYLTHIVTRTRDHKYIELGVSPRGALALKKAAQANALLEGRDFVVPDDIKKMVQPVLAHRIIVQNDVSDLDLQGQRSEEILSEIIEKIEVPI